MFATRYIIPLFGSLFLLSSTHFAFAISSNGAAFPNNGRTFHLTSFIPRGGATTTAVSSDYNVLGEEQSDEDEEDFDAKSQQLETILQYRRQQQHLLQLRSIFLSEALSSRGISVGPTMVDVSTPEGAKQPVTCDWDCELSTIDNPKSCLYSFDAEPNTKVIAPKGTTQYISLSALNRLRRTDPSKVEGMWFNNYSILQSWFSDNSEFSLLQFVGWKGFFISSVLLDFKNGLVLKSLLTLAVITFILVCALPPLEYIIMRVLVSSGFWKSFMSWNRFVHAALPLKLLMAQMAWKFVAGSFGKLEQHVRDHVIDIECSILEDCIPLTSLPQNDHADGQTIQSEDMIDDNYSEEEYDLNYDDEEDSLSD